MLTSCCRCKGNRLTFVRLNAHTKKSFSTTRASNDVQAAEEIKFDDPEANINKMPARILPASPSYFTGSPQFNDNVLTLRQLIRKYETLPVVSQDQAPRQQWLKLAQYRSSVGEPVSAARYSKVVQLLTRLNRIDPNVQPREVKNTMQLFMRPRNLDLREPEPPKLDKFGRARGMGRRKESSARVYLVEGNGQVLVNGRNLVDMFPRAHDRESALWALKTTDRLNRYNVWAVARGGGVTGQAESITLALARALLVHEPALKPVLRKGEYNC